MTTLILPIILFAVCAALLAGGMLAAGMILGPKRQGAVKQMPYESGMDPIHDTRRKFDVRFHLVAIAFLIFDVELLFLYPWAAASGSKEGIDSAVAEAHQAGFTDFSRGVVLIDVLVFMVLLTAGFVYAWKKGAFQWR